MGFGRASTSTMLGQSLDFRVVLRQESGEFIDAECVSAEVTAGDDKLPKQALRVAVEGQADAAERTLRVTSSVGITEPVVQVTLGVGCPPRLSRTFTTFVDPPEIRLAQQEAPAAPAPAGQPAPASAPAPPAAVTPAPAIATPRAAAPAASPAPRRSAPRRTPRPAATARAPAPPAALTPTPASPRRPATATQRPSPSAPAPAGPRLQLEAAGSPARTEAVEAERAASAAAAATVAASAAAEAASQASAAEAGRIRALEEALNRLKTESQKANDSLASLRARVQQAEAERYGNPLVYALAGLTALLALALLLLWRKRAREQQAQWWSEAAGSRVDAAKPSRLGDDSQLDDSTHDVPQPAVVVDVPEPARLQPTLAPETRPAVAEPRRPVSVEELIDLEQQAEFFAVLGQDEAAIDLLMNHLRSTGGISPLPYLKLLDLYRRRGERESYERIRERFNRRFNAYAPEWSADPSSSRSLEDYPQVMQRLEALWPNPQAAMDELEALLFRRDEGETFDVPAYGEVLFLYSLARDRLERPDDEATPAVDILLPIGDGPRPEPALPLLATIPIDAKPDVERPLSLDLDVSQTAAPRFTDSQRAERYEDSDFSFRSDAGDKLKPRR